LSQSAASEAFERMRARVHEGRRRLANTRADAGYSSGVTIHLVSLKSINLPEA
jgi:hypothetical protein